VRNNSGDTKVDEGRKRVVVPRSRSEIPLEPVEKTMVKQAVPLQPMEVHSGADIRL